MKLTLNRNILNTIILLFVLVSCNNDTNPIIDESCSEYSLIFNIIVEDVDGNYLLNGRPYSESDISIKPLQENDTIVRSRVVYNYVVKYEYSINLELASSAPNGIKTHKFVIEWNHSETVTTDTISCEIYKTDTVVSMRKVWVNNILNHSPSVYADTPLFPHTVSTLIKVNPDFASAYDINNSAAYAEKEEGGIKYRFWLSDIEGREVNVFDEQTVRDEGFLFNISVTNNTGKAQRICALGTRGIFDPEHKYRGSILQDLLPYSCNYAARITVVNHGEIYKRSERWCHDENPRFLLPKGKYYAYSRGKINVTPNDFWVPNIMPVEYDMDMSVMMVNFEVK